VIFAATRGERRSSQYQDIEKPIDFHDLPPVIDP
jgi:hypothetical protein